MKVICPKCQTRYKLSKDKLARGGCRANCARCGARFVIRAKARRAEEPAPVFDEVPEAEDFVCHQDRTVIDQVPELQAFNAMPALGSEMLLNGLEPLRPFSIMEQCAAGASSGQEKEGSALETWTAWAEAVQGRETSGPASAQPEGLRCADSGSEQTVGEETGAVSRARQHDGEPRRAPGRSIATPVPGMLGRSLTGTTEAPAAARAGGGVAFGSGWLERRSAGNTQRSRVPRPRVTLPPALAAQRAHEASSVTGLAVRRSVGALFFVFLVVFLVHVI